MKTIIEMARDSGFCNYAYEAATLFERFATLVEAAQLERLLQGVEMPEPAIKEAKFGGYDAFTHDQLRSTVAAAVLRERKLHCACIYVDGVNTEQCELHEAWCDTLHEQADYRRERDTLKAENERLRDALKNAVECTREWGYFDVAKAEAALKGQP